MQLQEGHPCRVCKYCTQYDDCYSINGEELMPEGSTPETMNCPPARFEVAQEYEEEIRAQIKKKSGGKATAKKSEKKLDKPTAQRTAKPEPEQLIEPEPDVDDLDVESMADSIEEPTDDLIDDPLDDPIDDPVDDIIEEDDDDMIVPEPEPELEPEAPITTKRKKVADPKPEVDSEVDAEDESTEAVAAPGVSIVELVTSRFDAIDDKLQKMDLKLNRIKKEIIEAVGNVQPSDAAAGAVDEEFKHIVSNLANVVADLKKYVDDN